MRDESDLEQTPAAAAAWPLIPLPVATGILDILCKFRGLNAFPFHRELRCPIDVGGWMLSGTFQGISLLDGGSTVYDAVANEDSSGSSCAARSSGAIMARSSARAFADASSDRLYRYAEWHVGNISAELRSLTYPCCPNEPWPVIAYDVRLTREQTFFVRRARAHQVAAVRGRV